MRKLPEQIRVNEFEQVSKHLTTISKIFGEVGHLLIGEYIGTGALKTIFTELNPRVIIIIDESATLPVIWFESMTGTNSKKFDGTTLNNAILGVSDTRDGFKIGTNAAVNTNATHYKFLCIGR